jgi:hypothetical protein
LDSVADGSAAAGAEGTGALDTGVSLSSSGVELLEAVAPKDFVDIAG